jgi:hypothetical protein
MEVLWRRWKKRLPPADSHSSPGHAPEIISLCRCVWVVDDAVSGRGLLLGGYNLKIVMGHTPVLGYIWLGEPSSRNLPFLFTMRPAQARHHKT